MKNFAKFTAKFFSTVAVLQLAAKKKTKKRNSIAVVFLEQQKHSSGGVLRKRGSENMQQIYRRTPMPKCDFNNVDLKTFRSVNFAKINSFQSFIGSHTTPLATGGKMNIHKTFRRRPGRSLNVLCTLLDLHLVPRCYHR